MAAHKDNPFQDPNFTPVEYDPQYILQVNHLKKYFPIKSGRRDVQPQARHHHGPRG